MDHVQILGKPDPAQATPGEHLRNTIEAGYAAGWTLVTVVPYWDEIVVIWAPQRKETATQKHRDVETR